MQQQRSDRSKQQQSDASEFVFPFRSENHVNDRQRRRAGCVWSLAYNGTVRLLETGGVELTVTNIQVQALLGSNILATASTVPMVSVSANASSDAVFAFAADTHVQASALTVNATVEFRDANGNTGAVSSSFSCFGCWDY